MDEAQRRKLERRQKKKNASAKPKEEEESAIDPEVLKVPYSKRIKGMQQGVE